MKTLVYLLVSLVCCPLFAVLPDWVERPESGCSSFELCVVGEGSGFLQAENNANANLARFFESQVKSKFAQETSLKEEMSSLDISEELTVLSEAVLNGVTIKKRFEGDESVYVLAVLDKNKTGMILRGQIGDIDKEVSELLKTDGTRGLFRSKDKIKKRKILALHYYLVSNMIIPEPDEFSQIATKKREITSAVVLHLQEVNQLFSELKPFVASILSKEGFKIVENEKDSTHIIKGELLTEQMHLKVVGFEKQKLTIILTLKKNGESKENKITQTVEVSGRTANQVKQLAFKQIESYLVEGIFELNFTK